MSVRTDRLIGALRDRAFRDHFSDDQIYELLALQIRQLREKNGWTQEELGAKLGLVQSAIARVENPDYTGSKISTLSKLARAFDVALIVRYAPFSELADWLSTLSPRSFVPASFQEELAGRTFSVATEITAQGTLPLDNCASYGTADVAPNIYSLDAFRIRREESSSIGDRMANEVVEYART